MNHSIISILPDHELRQIFPPPDFYNDKLKLMMDVMRIDDHAFESKNGKIVNPTNQRESVIQKQIRKSGLLDSFPNVKNVIVTAVTDLTTDEDHNYKFYYSNFERVLMKQIIKLIYMEKIIQDIRLFS